MGTVGARGQAGSSAINSELPRLLVGLPSSGTQEGFVFWFLFSELGQQVLGQA